MILIKIQLQSFFKLLYTFENLFVYMMTKKEMEMNLKSDSVIFSEKVGNIYYYLGFIFAFIQLNKIKFIWYKHLTDSLMATICIKSKITYATLERCGMGTLPGQIEITKQATWCVDALGQSLRNSSLFWVLQGYLGADFSLFHDLTVIGKQSGFLLVSYITDPRQLS